MGKVTVKVKLSNFIDMVMVNQGILNSDQIRSWEGNALVDTGAYMLIIPQSIGDVLGLNPYKYLNANLLGGDQKRVGIAGGVFFEVQNRQAEMECAIYESKEKEKEIVLIGQIPLEALDLHVDCKEGKLIGRPESPDSQMIDIY